MQTPLVPLRFFKGFRPETRGRLASSVRSDGVERSRRWVLGGAYSSTMTSSTKRKISGQAALEGRATSHVLLALSECLVWGVKLTVQLFSIGKGEAKVRAWRVLQKDVFRCTGEHVDCSSSLFSSSDMHCLSCTEFSLFFFHVHSPLRKTPLRTSCQRIDCFQPLPGRNTRHCVHLPSTTSAQRWATTAAHA